MAAHVATRPFREPAQRYSVVAGGVGSIAGLSLADVHGIDHLTKAVIVALITGLPPWLWEVWWKQRRLRGSEQPLVLPEASNRADRFS